jgi:sporadic carbohydrate cluster protein (TIGR04323 family)
MGRYKENKNVYAGYINLKAINGIIFPSYAQNQVNKDYIVNKLCGEFYMSTNENTYGKNNIILRSLIENSDLNGVCLLSIFSLPEIKEQRISIYKKTLKLNKELHFVFEEKKMTKFEDIEVIENLLIFNLDFFVKKKTKLTKYENSITDKSWQFI